jgi:bifunctional oligoribonuclease and PAP phosphatase NrnA
MTSLLYQNVQDQILKAGHILLLTDERIDGDTMGSTMGLFHVLKELGKRVEVFSPKPLPSTFKYLPNVDVIRRDADVFLQTTIDLVIICDCSDGEYIKKFLPTMPHKVPLISFDHHATNPMYGTINIVEPKAASTADVVWRFLKSTNWPISAEAAQCILTGICTDTVLFSTPNTTTDALDASAELVKLGAYLPEIVRHNLMNKSVSALKLWGLAMERLFHDDTFNATATVITKNDIQTLGGTEEDISGISGFLHSMLEGQHEVVLVYRETEDGAVKGSLRSRGRDVAELAAQKYGGGGHKLAAGFKIPNAKLVEKDGRWVVEKK